MTHQRFTTTSDACISESRGAYRCQPSKLGQSYEYIEDIKPIYEMWLREKYCDKFGQHLEMEEEPRISLLASKFPLISQPRYHYLLVSLETKTAITATYLALVSPSMNLA